MFSVSIFEDYFSSLVIRQNICESFRPKSPDWHLSFSQFKLPTIWNSFRGAIASCVWYLEKKVFFRVMFFLEMCSTWLLGCFNVKLSNFRDKNLYTMRSKIFVLYIETPYSACKQGIFYRE